MSSAAAATNSIPATVNRTEPWTLPGARWHAAARVLLLGTLFAAPLAYGAVLPWAWSTLTVLASVLLFLWAVGCAQQGTARVSWSPLYLPASLFLLLGAIQYFGHLTVDRVDTREALLKLVTDLIFFFLAGQLWADNCEKGLVALGFPVAVYTFLLSASAILQFFSGPAPSYLNYWRTHSLNGAFGPYVNRDHYAGLMELLIPLAAAYALSRREERSKRGLYGLAIILPIGSTLLTGSRGGFVALLAEILILGAILALRAPALGRRALISLGALAVAAAAVLFFWIDPGGISRRLGQVVNLSVSHEESYTRRLSVAWDSRHILREHPWVGTGLGSFETAYPRFQTIPDDLKWNHAHNDVVEALTESGLVGGLLILVALAMFFRFAFTDLSRKLHHEVGWIRFGAAVGCCGLLVHSLCDFNLRDPATAAWFAVCAGISIGQVGSSRRRGTGASDRVN
jgi:O-antigen ligase